MLRRIVLKKREETNEANQSNLSEPSASPRNVGIKVSNNSYSPTRMIQKNSNHNIKIVGKRFLAEKNTVHVSTSSSQPKKKHKTNHNILNPFPVAQKFRFYSSIAIDFSRGTIPVVRNFHFPTICSNREDLWEIEEDAYNRFITYEEFSKEWEETHSVLPSLFNRKIEDQSWTNRRNMKTIRFTIPDLSCREISSARMLRGPRPLRVQRDISIEEEKLIPYNDRDRGWKMKGIGFGLLAPKTNSRKYYFRHRLNDYYSFIQKRNS